MGRGESGSRRGSWPWLRRLPPRPELGRCASRPRGGDGGPADSGRKSLERRDKDVERVEAAAALDAVADAAISDGDAGERHASGPQACVAQDQLRQQWHVDAAVALAGEDQAARSLGRLRGVEGSERGEVREGRGGVVPHARAAAEAPSEASRENAPAAGTDWRLRSVGPSSVKKPIREEAPGPPFIHAIRGVDLSSCSTCAWKTEQSPTGEVTLSGSVASGRVEGQARQRVRQGGGKRDRERGEHGRQTRDRPSTFFFFQGSRNVITALVSQLLVANCVSPSYPALDGYKSTYTTLLVGGPSKPSSLATNKTMRKISLTLSPEYQ